MGRLPGRCRLARQLHRLALLGLELLRGELPVRHRHAAARHQLEHGVPPLGDLGVRFEGQVLFGRRAHTFVVQLDVAGRHRIPHQVVVRRGLRQGREGRRLARRQLVERLAEVRLSGGLHAIALVAVVVVVQVGRDDPALARIVRIRPGQADRLDDLLELPLDRPRGILDEIVLEQAGADELLRDGGGTTAVASDRIQAGRHDGRRVEARVLPERLVLHCRGRVEQHRRDLLERDDLALELTEPCELGRAGPVENDDLLGQAQLLEAGDGREAVRQGRIDADCRECADDADAGEEDEDDDRQPAGGRPAGGVGTVRAARVGVRTRAG